MQASGTVASCSSPSLVIKMDVDLDPMRELVLAENLQKLREYEDSRPVTTVTIPDYSTPCIITFPGAPSVLQPEYKRVGFNYLPVRGYFRQKETYGKFLELDSTSTNFNYLLSDCTVVEADFVKRLGNDRFGLKEAVQYWRRHSIHRLLGSVYYSEEEDAMERAVIAKMRDILIYLKGVSFTLFSIRSEEQPITMGTVLSNFAQCYCRICHKYICSAHDLNDPVLSQQENRSQDPQFHKCSEPRCVSLMLSFEPILLSIQRQEVRSFQEILLPGDPANVHAMLMKFKLFDVFGYQICKLGNYLFGCCQENIPNLSPLMLNRLQVHFNPASRQALPRDSDNISVPLCNHEGPCTDCACAEKKACQKQCGCQWNCSLRFAGCRCSSSCRTESNCLCRTAEMECDLDTCTCLECQNIQVACYFKRHNIAKTSIAISTIPSAGFGLFTREAIPIGTFIGVYSGELCRAEDQDLIKGKPSYLWGFDKDRIINAKYKGNKSRFMNHGDNSNVTVRVVTALGSSYVIFTTARAIAAGEELTINYGKDSRRII